MIIFLIDHRGAAALRRSRRSLEQFAASQQFDVIVIPAGDIAVRMNEVLSAYYEPFFITLQTGIEIREPFLDEVKHWIGQIEDDVAGVEWAAPGQKEELLEVGLWRTSAILEPPTCYFTVKESMPFEMYLFIEKRMQLHPRWKWKRAESAGLTFMSYHSVRWKQQAAAWAALEPILSGKPFTAGKFLKPTVTVVACAYNAAKDILWMVRSVLLQKNISWELIIVDDGSSDETLRMLERISDPRIIIVHHPQNRGKSHALNSALALAGGEWLLEVDSDDWLAPDCLAHLYFAVQSLGNVGCAVASHAEWIETLQNELVYRTIRNPPAPISPARLLETGVPLAPRMYHVPTLLQLGGWLTADPFQGRLFEDFQMLYRLLLKNYRIVSAANQDPLYHRRIRRSSISQSNRHHFQAWKSWLEQQFS